MTSSASTASMPRSSGAMRRPRPIAPLRSLLPTRRRRNLAWTVLAEHDAVDFEQTREMTEIVRYHGAQLESPAAIKIDTLRIAWSVHVEPPNRQLTLQTDEVA